MAQEVPVGLGPVIRALETVRVPVTESEYQIHTLIAAALSGGGFSVRHEVRIAPRCRIDFVAAGNIGIEVKRGKPDRASLIRQCGRYLSSDEIEALIVVVDTRVSLPDRICLKPVRVLGLNRLWGIALP